MTRRTLRKAVSAQVLCALLYLASPVSAETTHQSFTLLPGWNAVYLEIQPDPPDLEVQLAGIPYSSVWTWNPRLARAEELVDPRDGLAQRSGWFGHFPTSRPESILNNLFALRANRAYLIKIEGGAPVPWQIQGKPRLEIRRWQPDEFTLTGLTVDPATSSTFDQWLASSPAHAGQPIYRLAAGGTWRLVDPGVESPRAGEAYWFYTRGPSSWQGPLEVDVDGEVAMDFGASLGRIELILRNPAASAIEARLEHLPSSVQVPLAYRQVDEVTGEFDWAPLPAISALPVPAEGRAFLSVVVRRADMTTRAEHILSITDGRGSRIRLLVGADPKNRVADTP